MVFKKENIPWNNGLKGAQIFSEETRRKMSINRTGEKNHFFGKHHTEQTKQRIRLKKLGNKPWNVGKKNVYSEETIQKMRNIKFGKRHTEESKQKMKGRIPWMKGKHHTFESRKKLSIGHKGLQSGKKHPNWGKHHSVETNKKNSETHKKLWKNEEYAKRVLKGLAIRPNGKELYLDYLLQNYFPDEWKYVGDGNTIINGLCPDFINVNGKKQIIELFGEYWHLNNDKYTRTEEGRKKVFSELGYSTLIIWVNELRDEEKVIEKIKSFMI